MRWPAFSAHQVSARAWASARSAKSSPAKKLFRTYCTIRATRGLSCGWATLAGSVRNPQAWAYSNQPHSEPRIHRITLGHNRAHVVGNQDLKHSAEEPPRRLTALDERLQRLGERQPHKHVPRVDRSEDQRVHHPAAPRLGVDQHAHPGEVDLALNPGLTVGNGHRGALTAPIVGALRAIAVQSALRHDHPVPGQQVADLDYPQTGFHPRRRSDHGWCTTLPTPIRTRRGGLGALRPPPSRSTRHRAGRHCRHGPAPLPQPHPHNDGRSCGPHRPGRPPAADPPPAIHTRNSSRTSITETSRYIRRTAFTSIDVKPIRSSYRATPNATRRVVPLLANRWSHDRG